MAKGACGSAIDLQRRGHLRGLQQSSVPRATNSHVAVVCRSSGQTAERERYREPVWKGDLTVQTPNPQKSGAPRVPCIPKLLKARNFLTFNGGIQRDPNWSTWTMAHKRCSRISYASRLNNLLFPAGFIASPGAGGRVFSDTQTGRRGNDE